MPKKLIELGSVLGQIEKLFPQGLPTDTTISTKRGPRVHKKGKKGRGTPAKAFAQHLTFTQGKLPAKSDTFTGNLEHFLALKPETRYALYNQDLPSLPQITYSSKSKKGVPFQASRPAQGIYPDLKAWMLFADATEATFDKLPSRAKRVLKAKGKKAASPEKLKKRFRRAKKKVDAGKENVFINLDEKGKGGRLYLSGPGNQLFEVGRFGQKKKKKRRKKGMSGAKMGQPFFDNLLGLRIEPPWLIGGVFAGSVVSRSTQELIASTTGLPKLASAGLVTGTLSAIQWFAVNPVNTKMKSFMGGMILGTLPAFVERIADMIEKKLFDFAHKKGLVADSRFDFLKNVGFSTGPMITESSADQPFLKGGMSGTDPRSRKITGGSLAVSPLRGMGALSESQKESLQKIEQEWKKAIA